MDRVEYYYEKFEDYPKGIVLKILLSIYGVRFTDAALNHEDILDANTARYFIFSYDDQKVSAIKNVERIPVYFQILNIDGRKKGPTVQVRTATAKWTPYVFDVINGEVRLCEQLFPNAPLRPIAQITFEPRPEYNFKKNGVSPRFDICYLEPGSVFCEPGDEDQREHYPPPVEFFLKTSRGLYDLEREYDMPYPTGYPGRPGYGECLFTQSAQYDWDDSVR